MWDGVKLAGYFALHMVLGAIFFVILASVSFAIAWFTAYISKLGAPVELVYTCNAVEWFLLLTDVICFVVFVLAQTRNYISKSWTDGR